MNKWAWLSIVHLMHDRQSPSAVTMAEIVGLVRPAVVGLVPQRLGGCTRSAVYEPIVTREMFAKARRTAQMRVEGVEIVPPGFMLGGHD